VWDEKWDNLNAKRVFLTVLGAAWECWDDYMSVSHEECEKKTIGILCFDRPLMERRRKRLSC
jgi:hypothetical protein